MGSCTLPNFVQTMAAITFTISVAYTTVTAKVTVTTTEAAARKCQHRVLPPRTAPLPATAAAAAATTAIIAHARACRYASIISTIFLQLKAVSVTPMFSKLSLAHGGISEGFSNTHHQHGLTWRPAQGGPRRAWTEGQAKGHRQVNKWKLVPEWC